MALIYRLFLLFVGSISLFWILPLSSSESDRSEKKPLKEEILKLKKAGASFLPLPIYLYDPDYGHIGALTTMVAENGEKTDEYFCCAPYQFFILGLLAYSTKEAFFSTILADLPYFQSQPYRLRGSLNFNINQLETYYGYGSSKNIQLQTPAGQEASGYLDYEKLLRSVDENGQTYARFHQYYLRRLLLTLGMDRYLGPHLRLPFILGMENARVKDYSAAKVQFDSNGKEVTGIANTSKLLTDAQSGLINGLGGGWTNSWKFGLVYDKRNFEPDPDGGIYFEAIWEHSAKYLFSDYNYNRTTSNFRFFYSVFDKFPLVYAQRLLASYEWGNVPVYNKGTLSFADRNTSALGGRDTLRGYRGRRYSDQGILLSNTELRYKFFSWQGEENHISLALVGFIDIGSAFAHLEEISGSSILISYGMGLRFALNLTNIIAIDLGTNKEATEVYLGAGQQF